MAESVELAEVAHEQQARQQEELRRAELEGLVGAVVAIGLLGGAAVLQAFAKTPGLECDEAARLANQAAVDRVVGGGRRDRLGQFDELKGALAPGLASRSEKARFEGRARMMRNGSPMRSA